MNAVLTLVVAVALVLIMASVETADAQPPHAPTNIDTGDDDFTVKPAPILSLSAAFGVSDFTGDTMRQTTDAGASWNIRASLHVAGPVNLEISYIGSIQAIDALGISDDSLLVSNGAQTAIRLDAPITSAPIRPFLYGGAAWRHYSLVNTDDNTSSLSKSDDVFELPAGVGVSTTTAGVIVDLRGEVAYAIDADMVPDLTADGRHDGSDAGMHRWGVNLSVGLPL